MATSDLNNSKSGNGGKTNSDDTNNDNVPQDAALEKYEAIQYLQQLTPPVTGKPDELDWSFSKELDFHTVTRNTSSSTTCNVILQPNAKVVGGQAEREFLKDFDDKYGFKYGEGLAARHYMGIVQLDTGESRPADGEKYTGGSPFDNNRTVVFSGFNKVGATALNLDDDTIELQYNGMEEVLNDIQVRGVIQWDNYWAVGNGIPPGGGTAAKMVHTLGRPCIFNEKGSPDHYSEDGFSSLKFTKSSQDTKVNDYGITEDVSPTGGISVNPLWFNKSGIGPTKLWTSTNILRYIIAWYTREDETPTVDPLKDKPMTDLHTFLPKEYFGLVTKMPNYIAKIILHQSAITLLDKSTPMDLNIDGMGVWDAILTVVEASKDTMIHTSYDTSGKAVITVKSRHFADRDLTIEQPLKLSFGDFGAVYKKNNIIQGGSSLALDRQQSGNVGRIIVLGGNTRINTLISSFGTNNPLGSAPGNVIPSSTDKKPFTPSTGLIDFRDYMDFMLVRDSLVQNGSDGVEKLTMKAINYNWVRPGGGMFDNNPIILSERNNDAETALFGILEQPQMIRSIEPAFSERNKDAQDVKIYVSDIMTTESGKKYASIIPLEDSKIWSGMIIQGDHGGLEVKNKGRAFSISQTLLSDSPLKSTVTRVAGQSTSTLANNLPPVFMLCSVLCNWLIKGIAEIPNFNDKVHRTIIIEEPSNYLAINNGFAKYNVGQRSFETIPNGYIKLEDGIADPKEQSPLTTIQQMAEVILDKYVNSPQNTGGINLTGVQPWIQVGDPVEKILSGDPYTDGAPAGNRDLDFPTIINTVTFTFVKGVGIMTSVSLGGIDMPEVKDLITS